MKYINHLLFLCLGISTLLASCEKIQELPNYKDGEAVALTSSVTTISPTPADSLNNVVTFMWTSPNYSTDTSTYKFVLSIDSTTRNFSKEVTKTVTGQMSTSLTGKELNNILLNYGFSLNTAYELDVRVASSYTNNNERYLSNIVKLTVTPYGDPSVLTGNATSITPALATASQNAMTFSWSPSFSGVGGAVHYLIQYDTAGNNFADFKELEVGNDLYSRAVTQGEINETALLSGVPGGNLGKIEYRVKAVTAQGAVAYSNTFAVEIQSYVPILRFYLPGSYQAATGNGNDWSPETAPELIRDTRSEVFNHMYYTYIYLPAGASFKVTQGRSWDVNYGGTGGNLVQNSPDNFSVPTAGYYRITINRVTMKYDIREGRMGFVGGGTGAGWTPPNVFPNYAMGAVGTNLFLGIADLTADQWKLIDNNEWNNGSFAVNETRSYGSPGGSGSTMEVNSPNNFGAVAAAGKYRVIWDGRDPNNIKYEMMSAAQMRLVGDGIDQSGVNDWDPPSSPQMTYQGQGVWTITVNLKANKDIKFLAGAAWGAFDYEDNSGQVNTTGVPRPIRWDGDKNFKTPATAGSYTITLNEHTQRVTIN